MPPVDPSLRNPRRDLHCASKRIRHCPYKPRAMLHAPPVIIIFNHREPGCLINYNHDSLRIIMHICMCTRARHFPNRHIPSRHSNDASNSDFEPTHFLSFLAGRLSMCIAAWFTQIATGQIGTHTIHGGFSLECARDLTKRKA